VGGSVVGPDFNRGGPPGIHDDRSVADAEKALVPSRRGATVRNAWAAIEGQGEWVTENEQGGRRACVVVLGES